MVTSLKAGSPYSHLSRHRPDSLRSRVRRCSSKGCASTEDPPELRPRWAWALRDLAAGLPRGFRRALPTFGQSRPLRPALVTAVAQQGSPALEGQIHAIE